jgi:hypothetical protein
MFILVNSTGANRAINSELRAFFHFNESSGNASVRLAREVHIRCTPNRLEADQKEEVTYNTADLASREICK